MKSPRKAKHHISKAELRSFPGLCNVHRRFPENFTKKAYEFYQLLKKNSLEDFELDEENNESFRQLNQAVCSPPVLALRLPDLL